MPAQYIPRSTTLSDVLATHSRQLAHLMREVQSMWTVIRLIEQQQGQERAHRRSCPDRPIDLAPAPFEYEGDFFRDLEL